MQWFSKVINIATSIVKDRDSSSIAVCCCFDCSCHTSFVVLSKAKYHVSSKTDNQCHETSLYLTLASGWMMKELDVGGLGGGMVRGVGE